MFAKGKIIVGINYIPILYLALYLNIGEKMNNYDRIDTETIERLNIDMSLCNDWIKESFLLKESSILPAKTGW